MAKRRLRSQRALALAAGATLLFLAGCASGPRGIGRDGADANPPAGLGQVPDAEPRVEPIRSSGGTSKPYVVLGKSYVPIVDDRPFRESGLASWYGRKFHSQSTASGEPYDMYAMTAAHKTLPLPSYVRVRNPANGREAIVRVNDRGPFHEDRVIDLSYTAALKLDLLRGVAPVEIERITNDDIRTGAWRRGNVDATQLAQHAPPVTPALPVQPAASDNVAVPAAWTAPVAAAPRIESMEVTALPPLAPLTAPPAPAPSATPLPSPAEGIASAPPPGFWVQLGAFSQRDGAARFQQQVARELPALAPSLNVFTERGTHRLQAGPYASRDLARDTAEQVRNGLQLTPVIVERR
ncbi:septal ring lytic transglycosylase RlpA family protein [Variovorax sp. GT1P44]|uniref:septal ring lytic transglycosylase RlpA family protein n=1 Tax=Variovorax sp. GT1P44 TaxID=3443742 RepID=UPI003F467774